MCVIVDTNIVGDYVSGHEHLEALASYFARNGRLVYNKPLFEEYTRNRQFLSFVGVLKLAGRAREFPVQALSQDCLDAMVSDDPHVISLSLASGVRVVCTRDDNLIIDVKNKAILNAPRGKIFSGPGSAGLLNQACAEWQ